MQVENQFSHDNIDENANDQSKHQLDPKIGTKNPKGPESKCKDGGDTSINVPGDNVGTDVISPQEGASDEKNDEPPVLSSNPPSSGKLLACLVVLCVHWTSNRSNQLTINRID